MKNKKSDIKNHNNDKLNYFHNDLNTLKKEIENDTSTNNILHTILMLGVLEGELGCWFADKDTQEVVDLYCNICNFKETLFDKIKDLIKRSTLLIDGTNSTTINNLVPDDKNNEKYKNIKKGIVELSESFNSVYEKMTNSEQRCTDIGVVWKQTADLYKILKEE